ncbi:hypothetical protein IW262DRAFT_548492 [Armillaria fumosa]|nr:hypothetical protein IW262DRAFT_548492 [Armillaria fumosa]
MNDSSSNGPGRRKMLRCRRSWEAVGDPRFELHPAGLLGRHEKERGDDRAQMRVRLSSEISESYVDSMSHRIVVYNNDIKGGIFRSPQPWDPYPLPTMPSKAHQRRSRRAARPLIIRVHDRKAHVHGVLGEFDSNSSEIYQKIETSILEEVKQMSLRSTKNKENEKEEFEMMPESGHLEEWEAVEVEEEDWEDLCVGKGKVKMSYANALKGKPEG